MIIRNREYNKTNVGDKINFWTVIAKSKIKINMEDMDIECVCGERKEK